MDSNIIKDSKEIVIWAGINGHLMAVVWLREARIVSPTKGKMVVAACSTKYHDQSIPINTALNHRWNPGLDSLRLQHLKEDRSLPRDNLCQKPSLAMETLRII